MNRDKEQGKAGQILLENRAKLDELSQYLYEKETITGEEFMKILLKKKLTLVLTH